LHQRCKRRAEGALINCKKPLKRGFQKQNDRDSIFLLSCTKGASVAPKAL
jgi:hypothetical protein